MRTYRTIDGDVLDAICKRELGSEAHIAVTLKLNPGLAELGPVYAAGVVIRLPVIAPPRKAGTVRLWGRT